MLQRVFLAFTFMGALTTAGLGLTSSAAAWHGCDDDYGYSYAYPSYASYAPRVVYYPAVPVRSYPVFYGRVYDGHHHRYYDHDDHHDHHHHRGVSVSFGF